MTNVLLNTYSTFLPFCCTAHLK